MSNYCTLKIPCNMLKDVIFRKFMYIDIEALDDDEDEHNPGY